MPSTGFHSFLQRIVLPPMTGEESVNALNGLPFISTTGENLHGAGLCVCQCPQRASIHFYICFINATGFMTGVSMPSTGFHSFLQLYPYKDVTLDGCVNALNGLPFISTLLTRVSPCATWLGVNALNGLPFISTSICAKWRRN